MAEKNKTRKTTSKKTRKTTNTTAKKTTKKSTRKPRKKKVDNTVINLWVRNEELDSLSKIEQVKMPIEYRMDYVRTFGVESIIDVNEYNRWIEFKKNPETSNGRFYPSSIFPNVVSEKDSVEVTEDTPQQKKRFALFSR